MSGMSRMGVVLAVLAAGLVAACADRRPHDATAADEDVLCSARSLCLGDGPPGRDAGS